MQQERDNGIGRITVGRSWIISLEEWKNRDGWHDLRDSRQTLSIFRGDIANGEQVGCQRGDLEMFCGRIGVARIGEILLENGVKAVQLTVSPEISSIEIDPSIIQEIQHWVSETSDGEDLCQEIKRYCDKKQMLAEQLAAISFLVYAKRKGAIRWG